VIRHRLPRFLAAALLPWLAVSCAMRPVEPPPAVKLPRVVASDGRHRDYVRSVQTGPDRFVLQTGSRLFRKPGGPDIDLVGAVHVASADYYAALQRRLDRADRVLFEGVTRTRDEVFTGSKGGKGAYHRIASSLGLVMQADGIDYSRANFRRCDLSLEEMLAILDAEIQAGGAEGREAERAKAEFASLGKALGGRSLLTNSVIGLVGISPPLRERVRMMLVGVAQQEGDHLSPRLDRLINEDRNRHVLAEIPRQRGLRRVAVFYGAGHLGDIERGLRSMGYRPGGATEWAEAVAAHPYAAGIGPDEVEDLLSGR
jgi:hypothetical protein